MVDATQSTMVKSPSTARFFSFVSQTAVACLQSYPLRFPASGFPLKGGKARCWEFTSFRRFTHNQINERHTPRARGVSLSSRKGLLTSALPTCEGKHARTKEVFGTATWTGPNKENRRRGGEENRTSPTATSRAVGLPLPPGKEPRSSGKVDGRKLTGDNVRTLRCEQGICDPPPCAPSPPPSLPTHSLRLAAWGTRAFLPLICCSPRACASRTQVVTVADGFNDGKPSKTNTFKLRGVFYGGTLETKVTNERVSNSARAQNVPRAQFGI